MTAALPFPPGCRARMRNGEIVRVLRYAPGYHKSRYLVGEDNEGLMHWYANGRYLTSKESEYDLVERLPDEPPAPAEVAPPAEPPTCGTCPHMRDGGCWRYPPQVTLWWSGPHVVTPYYEPGPWRPSATASTPACGEHPALQVRR